MEKNIDNIAKSEIVYLLDETSNSLERVKIFNKILEYYNEDCVYPEIFIVEVVRSNYQYKDELLNKYAELLLKGFYSSKNDYCNLYIRLELIIYLKDKQIKELCIKETLKDYIGKNHSTGIEDFIKYIGTKELIIENYDSIIEILKSTKDMKSYFKIVKNVIKIDQEVSEKINIFLKDNFNSMIERIVDESLNINRVKRKNNLNLEQVDSINMLVKMLIEELIFHEKASYIDVEYIAKGASSIVIGIKNRVLKIGIQRFKYKIPNSEYILQPIIRHQFSELNNYTVEVSNRVDVNSQISINELYNLYKKLRVQGIYWVDIDTKNVGKLLNDNVINYDDIKNDEKISGMNNIKKVLKKGELVVLDTDLIYLKDELTDIEKAKLTNVYYEDFEKIYLDEQKDIRKQI